MVDTETKNYIEKAIRAAILQDRRRVPMHTHNGVDSMLIPAANLPSATAGIAVGGLYLSTTANNPSVDLGYGTWTAYGAGYALVGYKSGDSNFGTLGGTVGAATVTLSTNEIPSHNHGIIIGQTGSGNPSINSSTGHSIGSYDSTYISNTGGGAAHNNIQPSIVVNIWERTA